MFWAKGKLAVARLAMAFMFSLIGLSLGQGEAPGHDKPRDPPPAHAGGPQKKGDGQPAAEASSDNLLRGVIAQVGDPFKEGLKVQWQGSPMLLLFDKDTTILFANRKKATVADLKPGRWISFKNKANLEPMGILRARVERVVLDPPDDGTFPVNSLAVSRDRKWIATVGWTFGVAPPVIRVVLVNAETGKVVREMECDTHPVNKLAFSPDGKLLYGGVDPFNFGDHFFHWNGRLFVWDVATGKRVQEMTAGLWALSPDGTNLATVENWTDIDPGIELPPRKALPPTFTLQVLDTATWKQVALLHEENAKMTALCFSPDGTTLAVSVRPYDIRLWDWRAGKDRRRIEATKWKEATTKMWGAGWVPYLEFSPDGSLLASMTDLLPDYYETPRKIDLWDTSTGKLVRSLETGQYRPLHLTFTPKGDQIAMIEQVQFRLVDAVSGKMRREFRCQAGSWIGLAPALYRQGLAAEQAPRAGPVFQQLWNLTGGAGIEPRKSPKER
jgi:WD40 repeat protein